MKPGDKIWYFRTKKACIVKKVPARIIKSSPKRSWVIYRDERDPEVTFERNVSNDFIEPRKESLKWFVEPEIPARLIVSTRTAPTEKTS